MGLHYSNEFKSLIYSRGYTYAALARAAGVKLWRIQWHGSGRRGLLDEHRAAIARVLRVRASRIPDVVRNGETA